MERIRELKHIFIVGFLNGLANNMVLPVITDVTMKAVCPGQDRCSLAIYLSGTQQAIIGVGSVVITPLIGNLSDQYGRKTMLTLPLTLSVFPMAILACSTETKFFYAYYVIRTLTGMVSDSINCLSLAYVADNVSEQRRASAFGVLSGVFLTSFVCGTFSTRFLSISQTFQIATAMAIVAVVYMRIFLKEKDVEDGTSTQPMLNTRVDIELPKRPPIFKKILTIPAIISLLKNSTTFSQVAVVAFFQTLAEGGVPAATMYYWKARFHFTKNQYSIHLLLAGSSGIISQLIFMPLVAPVVPDEKLLSLGLFMAVMIALLYGISWSSWVPYATTSLIIFAGCAIPTLRSIASKQFGHDEQGKAQGCISSITSFANIISPLIFSPLTALFLSDKAPFHFPGFSLLCIAFALMIAFVQSVMIKPPNPILNGM